MSPADRRTTSPGTRWPRGVSRGCPSRTTVAVTLIMALSLAAASSARDSWTKRRATPSTTMLSMTVAARGIAGHQRDGRQQQEQDHQRIDAGMAEDFEPPVPLFLGDHVGADTVPGGVRPRPGSGRFRPFPAGEHGCHVAPGDFHERRGNRDVVRRPPQSGQDVFRQDKGRQDRHRCAHRRKTGALHHSARTGQKEQEPIIGGGGPGANRDLTRFAERVKSRRLDYGRRSGGKRQIAEPW